MSCLRVRPWTIRSSPFSSDRLACLEPYPRGTMTRMTRMTPWHLVRPRVLAPVLAVGLAGAVLVAPAAAAPSITPNSAYVDASLGEIPTAVAVSDTGVIAASLYDAQAVALVDPDGTVRQANLGCSPADVAISPDGATAWAVCQESVHLNVVDVASLVVSVASMEASGLDSVDYLPAVDKIVIGSIEGPVLAVEDVSTGGYRVYLRTSVTDVTPRAGVTQLAPVSDGSGAYAITDAGDLLFVSIEFGGQVVPIARASSKRSFQSIALGPFDTALYAAVVDYSSGETVTTVDVLDMGTGDARQSVPVDVTGGQFTTLDLAASYRSVYLSLGAGVETPTGNTGLLLLPVTDKGRLTGVQGASVPIAGGAGTAVSADFSRVAFGSTNAQAMGLVVDDEPYPATIRIRAKAKGTKVTVTGATTSMRPLTELAVYIKDLTKKKAKFTKQSESAFVDSQGEVTWKAKAPSKRFAVYVAVAGTKSKTVTVKRR